MLSIIFVMAMLAAATDLLAAALASAGNALLSFRASLFISFSPSFFLRPYQAFCSIANQVAPACLLQCLAHQVIIIRQPELHQGTLHGFFLMGLCRVNLLPGQRIQPCIPHAGGQCARRRDKILHLLRMVAHFLDKFSQFNGIFQLAARVAGHKIGHKILLLAQLLIHPGKFFHETPVHPAAGLAHKPGYPVRNVLRSYFQLAADMMLTQLPEKIVLGQHEIVEADAGTNKDLLDLWQLPELSQELQIAGMACRQVLAGIR